VNPDDRGIGVAEHAVQAIDVEDGLLHPFALADFVIEAAVGLCQFLRALRDFASQHDRLLEGEVGE